MTWSMTYHCGPLLVPLPPITTWLHMGQGALSGMLNAATIKFGGAEVGGLKKRPMSPFSNVSFWCWIYWKSCGAFKSERVNDPKYNECWKSSCFVKLFSLLLYQLPSILCRCYHICLSSPLSLGSRFVIGQPIVDLVQLDGLNDLRWLLWCLRCGCKNRQCLVTSSHHQIMCGMRRRNQPVILACTMSRVMGAKVQFFRRAFFSWVRMENFVVSVFYVPDPLFKIFSSHDMI